MNYFVAKLNSSRRALSYLRDRDAVRLEFIGDQVEFFEESDKFAYLLHLGLVQLLTADFLQALLVVMV